MGIPLTISFPGQALLNAVEAQGALPDGVTAIRWSLEEPAPLPHIDIVVPPYMGSVAVLAALDSVSCQLVQSQSIGFDGVADALPAGHVFANAAGVHETSTAELALGLIIAAQRGLPDFVRAAERGEWAPERHASLADRRVLLIGHGGVGRAIAARLAPFEVDLTIVARTARETPNGPVHGLGDLPRLLTTAEIVIVAVPLEADTTHLIDDAFLSAAPEGALIVNVSRGKVADTAAVLDHARRGRLRFALDVVDPEPLPTGHPLFAQPNVLISPHVGGATSAMLPRMARLLREQIERMLRGEPPLNVVLRT
ncbi:MAG TPA: 2-hydroxyacid dehydrogenase [Candidatus Lumbricidophila sp.]|nr:2-hydroxyacid dehydrogenase [Candidatus Lumbricidophila sp.]